MVNHEKDDQKSIENSLSSPTNPVLITSDIELDIPDVNKILNSTEIDSDTGNKLLFDDSTDTFNHSFRRPQPIFKGKENEPLFPVGYKARRTLSSARLKSCSTKFLNCISSDDEDPFDYQTQTLPKNSKSSNLTRNFGEKRSRSSVNLREARNEKTTLRRKTSFR